MKNNTNFFIYLLINYIIHTYYQINHTFQIYKYLIEMIKITKAILILTMLKICFSTNNGIDVRYLEKKDIFSIRLTKQYFKLMKKDKSGSITLPYLFSSPALTNKISDDVRDNKNFIPSHITYRFNFITSIGDSTDYNQIEVI